MVTITSGSDATQAAFARAVAGEPAPSWAEVYFPLVYDASVAPPGGHVMSVFAQYVPYTPAEGTWQSRREEIGDTALAEVARCAPDVADCVVHREVLGPPDVEARIGLTGGHILRVTACPTSCGTAASPRAPPCPASTSAAPRRTPGAA